ncbi:MAG: hypothetical protein RR775_22325 [Massilia sp.]|uniref:hypothetical protein n=1 Tax=Massilia sp. TaxID=1882437 RepID=UPI002FC680B3
MTILNSKKMELYVIRYFFTVISAFPTNAFENCTSGAIKPFEKFLTAFGNNKAFSIARTEYPLTLINHEKIDLTENNQAIIKKKISRNEDAMRLTMAKFAGENGLELSIESLHKAKANVRMEKPDTDWLLTYHFVRKGNCWYLRHIEDHSL